MKAANPLTPKWHTAAGSDESAPTRFRIRGLTNLELADVTANAIDSEDDDGKPKLKYGSASIRVAIGRGLLEWENFADVHGNPAPFPADVTARITALGPTLMAELFWAILAESYLTEDQRKN